MKMDVGKLFLLVVTLFARCNLYVDAEILCKNSDSAVKFIQDCIQPISTLENSTSPATESTTTEGNSATLSSTPFSVEEPDRVSLSSSGSHANPPTNGLTPRRCSIGTILAVLGVWICLRQACSLWPRKVNSLFSIRVGCKNQSTI